jgi:hypothetical protein
LSRLQTSRLSASIQAPVGLAVRSSPLPNIKTLRIDRLSGWNRDPKGSASKLYRDAFPWLEAVGVAKGKADAAVDMLDFNEELFDYHYYHQNVQRTVSGEEKRDQFLESMRHLLVAQQKRVMAPAKKKTKKAKENVSA